MISISSQLRSDIIPPLKNADEIWIAVALLNDDGLSFIFEHLNKYVKQHYLIGIDLPTEPKALFRLHKMAEVYDVEVKIYNGGSTFHPKLYLIKSKGEYCAFIGSANCTNGGMYKNIELTSLFSDQSICLEILEWFNNSYKEGVNLTTKFLEDYSNTFAARLKRRKEDNLIIKKQKKMLGEEYEATLAQRVSFIKKLEEFKNEEEYEEIVSSRIAVIQNLKEALDYPSFKNINIDDYFSHHELGHLIPIAIPAIKRNMIQLKKLLKFLCDESIDIAVRYDRSTKGDYKVEGVDKAFISKILVMHNPKLYFVKNNKTELALAKYGLQLPRKCSKGEKYKIVCKFLRQICEETKIQNLAVLDYFLYKEGGIDTNSSGQS